MKLHEIAHVNKSTDYDDNDPLLVIMARRLLAADEKILFGNVMFAQVVNGWISDIWMDNDELNVVFNYDGEHDTGSSPLSIGHPDDFQLTKTAQGWELHEA